MKLTFVIVPEEQLLIERIEEDVTLKDILELTPKICADPNYHRELRALIDIRHATMKMSTTELGELTDFITGSGQSATGCLALVVKEPLETAMSHMFEKQMMHKREVAVFSSIEPAYQFLGRSHCLHDQLMQSCAKTLST